MDSNMAEDRFNDLDVQHNYWSDGVPPVGVEPTLDGF
jgi:hypothetical protein